RDKDGNLILAGYSYSTGFAAAGGAVEHEGGNAFVQKMNPSGSTLLWRAVLGGAKDESIQGVAVDAAGAIYVAGWTTSTDLPTTAEAFQKNALGKEEGFVAKLSADGKKLEYCTYLGTSSDDWLNAIAVDAQGQAVVTGWTASSSFPVPSNSNRSAFSAGPGMVIVRLDAAGKTLKQGTVLAGNDIVEGKKVLAPADGTIVVAADTFATDLPVVNGWQKTHGSAGMWKSANKGLDWRPAADGMKGLEVRDAAIDPKQPLVLYAATPRGVYKTVDGGVTWKEANAGLASTDVVRLAIDPTNPARLYVASAAGPVFRSTDGAASWQATGPGPGRNPYWLGVDPRDSKTIYILTLGNSIYKSVDGAETWMSVRQGLAGTTMVSMAIHPTTPNLLFAAGVGGFFRSEDGGMIWTKVAGLPADDIYWSITFDPKDAKVLWVSSYNQMAYKSVDGGATWRVMKNGFPALATVYDVKAHPSQADLVFAATDYGLYRSTNGGSSWVQPGMDLTSVPLRVVWPDPMDAGVVYAGGGLLRDAYLLHLDKDMITVKQGTYLGGGRDEGVRALAMDSAGDIFVAGVTESEDFAVTPEAAQKKVAGDYDAFLVHLDKQGKAAKYSTVLGGRQYESARGISLGPDGGVWLTGDTASTDFPITGGTPEIVAGGMGDVFLAKVGTVEPRYILSTVVGGTGYDSARAVEAVSDGVWIAGSTDSRDFGSGLAGVSAAFNGGSSDGFLIKVSGLAATLNLDSGSVELEVLLDGSEPVAVKRLKPSSPAGTLPLQVKVTEGAAWLKAEVVNGEIVVTANAAGLAAGEYSGSLDVSAPAAGVSAVKVAVKLKVKASTPPVLAADGVLHGAQLITGPIAPGLVIRLRGEGLAFGERKIAEAGANLPLTLGGTRVLINGLPAAIEWVSEKEISAIAPFGLESAAAAEVVVERGGLASAPVSAAVAPAAPGLFSADGSGGGQALARNEDGTANSEANPAERGRPVVLRATGGGATDPAGIDGALALEVLPKPVAAVEVLIGGIACDVYYAGAQPGSPAGYLELNVKAPEDAPAGPAVAVVVRIGGVESTRGVTIALK
ncbi:MAG: hypothetical protein HY821_15635, partial [Acidobacteria bacterium]|nr:hypothetical protein [Acidobacteriota bacterium]